MALYDITLSVKKKNRFDLFGLFSSNHIPDELEQSKIMGDYVNQWGGKVISKKMVDDKLILRIEK